LRKGAIWASKDQEGPTSNTIRISDQLSAAMHNPTLPHKEISYREIPQKCSMDPG